MSEEVHFWTTADLGQHQEKLARLFRDVDAVESVAALLVEAKRTMIEATFLLAAPCDVPPDTIFSRVSEAVAVLEAGVVLIDGAIAPDADGSQA